MTTTLHRELRCRTTEPKRGEAAEHESGARKRRGRGATLRTPRARPKTITAVGKRSEIWDLQPRRARVIITRPPGLRVAAVEILAV